MFISSSRNKFELLYQNSITDVFVGFRPPHVGAHLGGHQHGVSIQISIDREYFMENAGARYLPTSCRRIRNRTSGRNE